MPHLKVIEQNYDLVAAYKLFYYVNDVRTGTTIGGRSLSC